MRAACVRQVTSLTLGLLLALLPAAVVAQVKTVGSYPTKKLKDGGKNVEYLVLAKDGWLRFKAKGPQGVVVLLRAEARGEVAFELELDEGQVAQLQLQVDARISRGFFVPVPRGAHEVGMRANGDVGVRLVPVRRKALKAESVVAWRDRPAAVEPPPPEAPVELPPPPAAVEPPPAPVAVEPPPPPAAVEPPPPPAPVALPAPPPPPAEVPAAAPQPGGAEESVRVSDLPPPAPSADPAGPSLLGPWGLQHVWAAVPSASRTLLLGASLGYFYAPDFLVEGDTQQRLAGRLTLSGVPVEGLELYAGLGVVSSQNDAFSPGASLTVGDPFLGVRYGHQVLDWLGLGLSVQALFPTGGSGFTTLSTEGLSTRILAAFDLRPLPELLVALNVGYHFDNTRFIFDHELGEAQRFAAGVNPHDQVLAALGAAYTLGPVAPFLELVMTPAVGGGAPAFEDSPMWLTLGLRAWPFQRHDLHLVLSADVGILGVDAPAGKARIPPYDLHLGVAWDFGVEQTRVEVREVTRVVVREVPVPVPAGEGEGAAVPCAAPGAGRVRGLVLDAATGEPLGGARVAVGTREVTTFLSDPEQGAFATCPVAPGPLKIRVVREGYKEESQVVLVTEAPETPVTFRLQVATGQSFGTLRGTVRSMAGTPLQALVTIPARGKKLRADRGTGKFEVQLGTGTFDVLVSMPGFVTQRRKVSLETGDVVILNLELDPTR